MITYIVPKEKKIVQYRVLNIFIDLVFEMTGNNMKYDSLLFEMSGNNMKYDILLFGMSGNNMKYFINEI